MTVYLAAWALCSAISLWPFLLTPLPPLNDYPSHLARAYLIDSISSSPDLQRYYAIDWALIPNLAVDLVVPALSTILPVETAMTVFTGSAMLLLSSGVLAMNWSLFGRLSPAAFSCFLILFNRQLLWGFVGYLFTLGMSLWVFALWIGSAEKRYGATRTLLFSGASSLLFIGHLHAFATYAVLIGGYELSIALIASGNRMAALKRLPLAALQFVPPIALFLLFSPTRDRAMEIGYGPILGKIVGMLDAFHTYDMRLDAAAIGAVAVLAVLGFVSRKLIVHNLMVIPMLLLLGIYVILPTTMLGSFAADRRLATSVYFILAGSVLWRFSISRVSAAVLVLLAALFVTRTSVVATHWRSAGAFYSDLLQVIQAIPQGSRLAAAVGKTVSPFLEDPPVMFVASMAVVRRDAFVNTLFADEGHQPLRLLYRPLDVESGRLPHIFYVDQSGPPSEWRAGDPLERIRLHDYDYLLLLNTRYFDRELPNDLELVSRSATYSLYRVRNSRSTGNSSRGGSTASPSR